MDTKNLRKKFQHICRLDNVNALRKLFPTGRWSALQRCYFNCICISYKNKRYKTYCRSQEKLRIETIYHVKNYPFRIHPFSMFKKYWDSFMVLISVMSLIFMPWFAAFIISPCRHLSYFPLWKFACCCTLDFICGIDIIINTFTGYYNLEGRIIFDRRLIMKKYARSYFFTDLFSCIPLVLTAGTKNNTELLGIFVFTYVLIGLKLLRMVHMLANIRRSGEAWGMVHQHTKILQICLSVVVTLHWCATVLIMTGYLSVGLFTHDMPTADSWITYQSLWNTTKARIYITSLYRATCILTGGEYKITTDNTVDDYICQTIGWIASKLIFGVFFYLVREMGKARNAPKILYRKRLLTLLQYADQQYCHTGTKERFVAYYQFNFREKYFKVDDILYNISSKMRQDLILHKRIQLLKNIDFFENMPPVMLVELGAHLEIRIFLPGDYISKYGQEVNGMYLISSGTVVMYSPSGIEIISLMDGSYFGEMELITNSPAVCTTIAVEPTELYFLNKNNFLEAIGFLQQYRDVVDKIKHHIDKRYTEIWNMEERRSQLIDEIEKQHTLTNKMEDKSEETSQDIESKTRIKFKILSDTKKDIPNIKKSHTTMVKQKDDKTVMEKKDKDLMKKRKQELKDGRRRWKTKLRTDTYYDKLEKKRRDREKKEKNKGMRKEENSMDSSVN